MNNGAAVLHSRLNLSPAFLCEGPQPLLQAALVKVTTEIPNCLNFCVICIDPYMQFSNVVAERMG